MADSPLNRAQESADLEQAPAAAPATAKIVPDAPVAGTGDAPENPPPPDRPEIEPGSVPETDPDLQPVIPPLENPTI